MFVFTTDEHGWTLMNDEDESEDDDEKRGGVAYIAPLEPLTR